MACELTALAEMAEAAEAAGPAADPAADFRSAVALLCGFVSDLPGGGGRVAGFDALRLQVAAVRPAADRVRLLFELLQEAQEEACLEAMARFRRTAEAAARAGHALSLARVAAGELDAFASVFGEDAGPLPAGVERRPFDLRANAAGCECRVVTDRVRCAIDVRPGEEDSGLLSEEMLAHIFLSEECTWRETPECLEFNAHEGSLMNSGTERMALGTPACTVYIYHAA